MAKLIFQAVKKNHIQHNHCANIAASANFVVATQQLFRGIYTHTLAIYVYLWSILVWKCDVNPDYIKTTTVLHLLMRKTENGVSLCRGGMIVEYACGIFPVLPPQYWEKTLCSVRLNTVPRYSSIVYPFKCMNLYSNEHSILIYILFVWISLVCS